MRTRQRRLNLALQGGGAHGAFTWGVLDALLDDDDISLGWVSATSAGAVNAAALADGLASGRQDAKDKLQQVWAAVESAGVPDLLRLNPFMDSMARVAHQMSKVFSPYDFNPLGFDPLRRLLETNIDFVRIRDASPVELLIAATDVATGRPRLFRRSEMTVEAVLASACLPTLHHAVEIDGRSYWDGGFSANPDLLTLAQESPVEDTLIVQLNPLEHTGVPRSAREIADRVNIITFNQPLLRDVEAIIAAKSAPSSWLPGRGGRLARLKRHRFHLIEAGRHTSGLSGTSKIKPERGLLAQLHRAGLMEARKWLSRNRADIGRASTVDVAAYYGQFAGDPSPSRLVYDSAEATSAGGDSGGGGGGGGDSS